MIHGTSDGLSFPIINDNSLQVPYHLLKSESAFPDPSPSRLAPPCPAPYTNTYHMPYWYGRRVITDDDKASDSASMQRRGGQSAVGGGRRGVPPLAGLAAWRVDLVTWWLGVQWPGRLQRAPVEDQDVSRTPRTPPLGVTQPSRPRLDDRSSIAVWCPCPRLCVSCFLCCEQCSCGVSRIIVFVNNWSNTAAVSVVSCRRETA